jgi:hypothetical protein
MRLISKPPAPASFLSFLNGTSAPYSEGSSTNTGQVNTYEVLIALLRRVVAKGLL